MYRRPRSRSRAAAVLREQPSTMPNPTTTPPPPSDGRAVIFLLRLARTFTLRPSDLGARPRRLCAHADGGFGRQLGLGQLQQRPQPRHRGDDRAGRGPRRCSEGGAAGAWRTRPRNKNSGSTSSSLGSTATPAQGSDSVDRKPCHQPITDLTRDMLPHRASRRFGVNQFFSFPLLFCYFPLQ